MRTLTSCLVAAGLLLAACGSAGGDAVDDESAADGSAVGDDAGGDASAESGDDAVVDSAGESEDAEAEAMEPRSGGSLTYGTYSESTGFDVLTRGTLWPNPAIYDPLMRYDDAGNAEPYMAESMETDDNVTWLLKLREGVNFHDGTPLNAEAVIFNIERHMDPDNLSPRALYTEPIESMDAIDDLTVEFTLKRPFAPFAGSLTNEGVGDIPSPTAVQELGEGFNLNPVGAGPFKFVEWIADDRVVLEKNEDYWQEGLPYLDEIIYRPVPDTQTRQQAIVNGDVDITYFGSANEILSLKGDQNLVVMDAQANGAEGVVLNHNRPPFDDPRLREAFVSVLNMDVIADVRLGGQRELAGAIGLIGENSPYYEPEKEEVWPTYDPERAMELVAEYEAEGNDPSFTFVMPNTPDRRAFGDMAGQFFRDANWDAEFEYLDIAEFVASTLRGGDFQAAIMTYPANQSLYPLVWNAFHSSSASNWGKFSDPDVDAALERAVSAPTEEERAEGWSEVQILLAEQIPLATYARSTTAIVTQPWVHGVDKTVNATLFPATLWTEQ